ncbi:hypothetical protein [Bacteriovorax sp. Seq25_V]|uniref:hypothetical protein n=1 Tax=Bacteriovorax sp. Seq25_V TaxID=1201288 RepID=UPI00038A4DAD|nr:hypothetical protein [Bacteriovorax sp. Seq25_V]EQC46787.1 hypothetical protein M900_2562 [Bacteriovorax sp. Seq25_V]
MKFKLIITFLAVLNAFAIDFEDAVFPELATSSRALAMGNAFISKVDDASSVYYNPAGLGTVRYRHLHLSNFQFETNKGWLSSAAGGKATDVATKFPKAFSLDGTRELLNKNKGEISHSRFHFLPNFTTRYFSMGYLFSFQQRAYTGKEAGAKFEYAQRRDHGPYVALNLSLGGGIFKLGASATYLSRKEIVGEADAAATLTLEDGDYQYGKAFIITTGAKLTLPVAFLPTFSVVSHNTGEQQFGFKRGAGLPDKIKNSIDAGFSITPQVGNAIRIHMEVNMKDVTNLYKDVSSTRKILAGMEFDFARVFFIRFGYGDGFGSAGLGVKSRSLEFDLTTYAVDTTSNEFRGKEDRRFAIGFSTGF